MFLIFPETVQPVFLFGLCFSIFCFLCNIWEIIVYPFSFDYCSCLLFFNMPLNCLSSFNLQILITSLVFSNFSFKENQTKTSIKHRKMKTRLKQGKLVFSRKLSLSCATHSYWFDGCITFFLGSENLPLVKYSKQIQLPSCFFLCMHKKVNRYYIDHHHVHAITKVLRFLMMIEV